MKQYFLLILVISILVFPEFVKAQNRLVNYNVAYGMTNSGVFDLEFDKRFNSVYKAGVNLTGMYVDTPLRYTAGINLLSRKLSDQGLYYLNIPIGLQYINKSRVKILIGGGLYMNTLLWVHNKHEEATHTKIGVGGYGQIGTGYQLTDKYTLMLSLQISGDITKSSQETITNWHGSSTTFTDYLWDKVIVLGVYYSL